MYAWKLWHGKVPDSQADMLRRVEEFHSYGIRSAWSGMVVGLGDNWLVGYTVLTEWRTLTED